MKRTSRNPRYRHVTKPKSAQKILKEGRLRAGAQWDGKYKIYASPAATADVELLKDWYRGYADEPEPVVVEFDSDVRPHESRLNRVMGVDAVAWHRKSLPIESAVLKNRRTSRPPSAMSDDALARRFNGTINMTGDEIRRWHKSPLSKRASFAHIRAELPLLAKMKDTPSAKWTPAMWDKAARALNFVERHEAQMRAQGKRFGTGKLHVTEKRVVALLNWGRKTPGVALAKQLLDAA